MRYSRRFRFRNRMMIWSLALGSVFLTSGFAVPGADAVIRNPAAAGRSEQETELFFKAKEQVFQRRWTNARRDLEAYLKNFPEGRLRDEALYWMAYSLDKLSETVSGAEAAVGLEAEAVLRLNQLISDYSGSLWVDDALGLRLSIAGRLVAAGRDEFLTYIEEAVESGGKDRRQIGLQALASLARLDSDISLPVFRKRLESDPDPEVRRKVLDLLARFFPDVSMEQIEKAAREDPDKGVREAAGEWIGRLRMQNLPVRLGYSIYGCRLLDESLKKRFPEGRVETLPLVRGEGESASEEMETIRAAIGGDISRPVSSANGSMSSAWFGPGGRGSMITHRAGGYYLWIRPDRLELAPDRIKGEVRFRHSGNARTFDFEFSLAKGENRLLVARSGDRLSLLALRFIEVDAGAGSPESVSVGFLEAGPPELWSRLSRTFDTEPPRALLTEFKDLMGWRVLSSRGQWKLDELTAAPGLYNFGDAVAFSESPGEWTLIGSLSLELGRRRFYARKAILVGPDDQIAAAGDEILVPIDRPADFEVKGSRRIDSSRQEPPDYGSLDVSGTYRVAPGVEVRTARKSFDVAEFGRPVVNFQMSKAEFRLVSGRSEIPGVPGNPWILLGDILWLKDQGRVVGYGALMIDPERKLRARGLISVPLGDPAAFEVLRGRTLDGSRLLLEDEERRTRHFYPTLYSGVQGWEVYTTLNSGAVEKRNKRDFSLAQAVLRDGDREWILLGHLTLLEKERRFVAREAVLIDPRGGLLYGEELRISTDDPAEHEVVRR